MKRKEVTKFLSDLLITSRLSGAGKYYAKEVTLDYGKSELTDDGYKSQTRRIDYLQFIPENQLSVSGIEKGIFVCYEIKSCKADFLSGYGKTFIGEKNYLVMTMSTYRELKECGEIDKLPFSVGILVPIPMKKKYDNDRLNGKGLNPTENSKVDDWYLETVKSARKIYRQKSLAEMLFYMVRSGH